MFRNALRGITFAVCCLTGLSAQAQIGSSMVTFLTGKVGVRVGGGECSHMATEALRIAGGEFVASDLGADSPAAGDYVWGTLVTVISFANNKVTDSAPTVACQPGDVIQYGGAKIGTSTFPTKHTSVVASVNTSKRPNYVFQQNFGGKRTVQKVTIDTTKLTAGWLRIYRPIARKDAVNQWKLTVVNNTTATQAYTVMVGTSTVSSVSLTAANTAGSFRVHKVVTTGTVPCVVLSNGATLYMINAKGDEIYNPTSTTVGVRQLAQ